MTGLEKARDRRALFMVVTDYPGGAERIAFGAASELASRAGWRVEVVIVCSRLAESFSARVLAPGVVVRYGPLRNWFLSFPLLPLRLLFRRYDFVFTTHIYANALVSVMRRARLLGVRRHVMRESMSVFDRFAGVKTRLFARLYRLYGGEDLLIAQTRYMADHVRPWLPPSSARRLEAFPNPVDLAAIERAASEPLEPDLRRRLEGRSNILFCGRFVEFKRPSLALEVFHLISTEFPLAQLVFMGSGPLEEEVRGQAARSAEPGRVLFLGQRTNPYSVMAHCQYGLLTSANEGFPNVVLEMMASGVRKVVMTPCAGDLEGLSGVAVTRSHDAGELAAALREAIGSGEDCSTLYRSVAASRSVAAYVDQLLGPLGT